MFVMLISLLLSRFEGDQDFGRRLLLLSHRNHNPSRMGKQEETLHRTMDGEPKRTHVESRDLYPRFHSLKALSSG
jgi:hypothetical protein